MNLSQICSWNQPVLSNADNVLCSVKQREPVFELLTGIQWLHETVCAKCSSINASNGQLFSLFDTRLACYWDYIFSSNHLITKQYTLLGLQSSNLHTNTYSCFITFAFSFFSSKQKLTLCWSWTLVDSTASFVFLKINLSEPTCPLSRWILRFTTENMKQSNKCITVRRHFTHVYKCCWKWLLSRNICFNLANCGQHYLLHVVKSH